MRKSLLVAAGAALALSSCTTIQHSASTEQIDTRIYNLTVADVNVSTEKKAHTFNWNWTPFTTFSLSGVKESAAAELLIEEKADVLVEPQYIVKRRGLFRGGSVTVIGYPATYENFHPMTHDDALLLQESSPKVAHPVPVVNFASRLFKPKKPKLPRVASPFAQKDSHQFVSLLGGLAAGDQDTGGLAGAMWGKYNNRWGGYAKGTVTWLGGHSSCFFSGGAIKTMGNHWNFMFGAGLGSYLDDNDSDKLRLELTIPVEFGFQYHVRHFNAMIGITYATPVTGKSSGNLIPHIGFGYTF